MSKELKKPVLLMAQANREAVKNRKKERAQSSTIWQRVTV